MSATSCMQCGTGSPHKVSADQRTSSDMRARKERRTRHGIDYLRPEVQLLHKANGLRPKDRQTLMRALQLAHPGHPWLADLQAFHFAR